ncbi:hypothetical protein H648_40385gpHYPp4 [Human mastadenovirus D]|uniref:L1 13.6 kDa protein n=1 Tax=Human mastadenovirus D TaxID=130310 RepID=T1UKQ3_9ADEN|nr:hypothetical protein H648_40385gpHYPp4 [Human mastadenovirus D]
MRADGEELDFLPPVGRVAVDVMKVEIPPANRALVLMLVKASAVLAALHGLYLIHEIHSASLEEELQEWRPWLVVFMFACVGLTLGLLEDGEADEPAREPGPDLGAAGAQSEDEGAQLGAVHGVAEIQVRGQGSEVDLVEAGEGVLEMQMVLDFYG